MYVPYFVYIQLSTLLHSLMPRILAKLKQHIAEGDADAMNKLGCLYQFGDVLQKDVAVAKLLCERAVEAGNFFAMNNFGCVRSKVYIVDSPTRYLNL